MGCRIDAPLLHFCPCCQFQHLIECKAVAAALAEDIGQGDIDRPKPRCRLRTACDAVMHAKAPGVICGLDLARAAFRLVDSEVRFDVLVADGASARDGRSAT